MSVKVARKPRPVVETIVVSDRSVGSLVFQTANTSEALQQNHPLGPPPVNVEYLFAKVIWDGEHSSEVRLGRSEVRDLAAALLEWAEIPAGRRP